MVDTMIADALATQWAKASAAILLCEFTTNILLPEGLIIYVVKQTFHNTRPSMSLFCKSSQNASISSGREGLTHWGGDKMAAILQTTFTSVVSENGLVFVTRQAVNWAKVGLV